MKRLYVVDGAALAYRSYFAMGRSALATSEGTPTGAIFGTAMFLNKLVTEERPDFLAVVLDSPQKTFRHEMFPAYKGTRDKMPDELTAQLPFIHELFSLFGCPPVMVPGVEADDVIATMARRFSGPDIDVVIVSGDKDFMQLVDDHVRLYQPKKNEDAVIVDRAGVRERYGVEPRQMVDALALMGDVVDNVPGVAGIGEKGAAKLVATYGSLEGIYEHLNEITAKKQREGLERDKEAAFLSRELVTLKADVSLPFALVDLRCDADHAAANEMLLDFYQRFEFRSLASKLEKSLGQAKSIVTAAELKPSGLTIKTIESQDDMAALEVWMTRQERVACAIEPSGFDVIADHVKAIAFASENEAFRLALGDGSEVGRSANDFLRKVFVEHDGCELFGHGTKLAIQLLRNSGILVERLIVDLKVVDYLLDPNNYNHELSGICAKLKMPAPASFTRCEEVAPLIARLAGPLLTKLGESGQERVLREVEMPLTPVLAAMEQEGIYLDTVFLAEYSTELDKLAKDLEEQIFEIAGCEFNINSPKQLQDILFDKLKVHEAVGVKNLKKTKTGFSTDESVLSRLSDHPVPRLILEYRSVTKLKNTYVDTLPQSVNVKTHRIHTSFQQTVAATGRLSSDNPNLQNIPMRSELGRRIRGAFEVQNKDCVLISADYSQIELRLLAHLSQAEGLLEAFRKEQDVHSVTAARIFNVSEDAVTPLQRSRAKAVNFGIIYGMGPQRLAQETGVSLNEAKGFIARYFEVYPGIKAFTDSLIEAAKETGYCTTVFGRRRPIPEINERNKAVAARGQNIAVNAPIQGSAADLIKVAMINISRELQSRGLKTRMLLQVHDELVFEGPKDELAAATSLIRQAMEHAIKTTVPLRVEIGAGQNWLEAH